MFVLRSVPEGSRRVFQIPGSTADKSGCDGSGYGQPGISGIKNQKRNKEKTQKTEKVFCVFFKIIVKIFTKNEILSYIHSCLRNINVV